MDDTATLEPEKTTKLEIYYQGVTCILKIKCSTKINKERSLKKFIKRYNAMAKIVSQIGEEATTGVYGSVHTGKYMYNMSVIKKEMTVGGQLDN